MRDKSPQHKLLEGIHTVRVQISYDLQVGDAVVKKELPFVVGVLADMAGHAALDQEPLPDLKDEKRKFVEIDRDNFDRVMAGIRPRLALKVDNKLEGDGSKIDIELGFRRIEDFMPTNIIRHVEPLRKILKARQRLAELQSMIATNHQFGQLLQRILHDTDQLNRLGSEMSRPYAATPRPGSPPQMRTGPASTGEENQFWSRTSTTHHAASPRSQSPSPQAITKDVGAERLLEEILCASGGKEVEPQIRKHHSDLLGQLVEDIMKGEMEISPDIEFMLRKRIAVLDQLLSDQLNVIMHNPEFQKLEASWRGLHYLVFESETSMMLQIRVLHTSKEELLRDMERAREFDSSGLFKKVYSSEYEVFEGTPYGALIGDFEFGKHPQDIALLRWISLVAAAAHAPFIAAASPQLFGWESYAEMPQVRNLAKVFHGHEYEGWKLFRESEESRYVGLCLPHVLMRLPYGKATVSVKDFDFEEDIDGCSHEKYLWGNAAYAMGGRLTDAFARYGWCALIRGTEGGLVRNLPVHMYPTDHGEIAVKCPTEVNVNKRWETELTHLGFMPLIYCKNTDYAGFFSTQSCQKPFVYDTYEATVTARLSTLLPYVLVISRFAHYLKAIARDNFGSSMNREDREFRLRRWIMNYVCNDPTATQRTKCLYPLSEAHIDVQDDPRRPGCYRAIAYLHPHYQLVKPPMGLRLVVELPFPATSPDSHARFST